MERVVAAGRQTPVDLDEIANAGDLGRQDDPVVGQAGRLGQLGRSDRALDHRLDHHLAGVLRLGQARVRVHHLGQDGLIERAPVDADPDRLAVVDGDPDDGREVVVVVTARPDVAGVDAVLVQRLGRLGVLRQQLVAVVVEVADDRHGRAQAPDLAHDLRDRRGRRLGVDGDPDQLGAGVSQPGDLDRGGVRVGRVRVGHRLDDDRMAAADHHAADVHGRGARRRAGKA